MSTVQECIDEINAVAAYFVGETINEQLLGYKGIGQVLANAEAAVPATSYRIGKSLEYMVKPDIGGIGNPDGVLPKPPFTWNGATESYLHPDGGSRTLPSVPQMVYTPTTLESLQELSDFGLVKSNCIVAFALDALPNETPDIENSNFGYYQFDSHEELPAASCPAVPAPSYLFSTYDQDINVSLFTPQTGSRFYRNLTFGTISYLFEVQMLYGPAKFTLAPTGGTLGTVNYERNVTAIAVLAEQPCTVHFFQQRTALAPTGLSERVWYMLWGSKDTLKMYKFADVQS